MTLFVQNALSLPASDLNLNAVFQTGRLTGASYVDASGMRLCRVMRVPGRDGSPNRPPIPRYADMKRMYPFKRKLRENILTPDFWILDSVCLQYFAITPTK